MKTRKMGKAYLLLTMLTILAIPLLLTPTQVAAAETAGRTSLGVEVGVWKLTGGENDYSNVDQNMGLNLRRGLTPRWTLELGLKYGWVRPGVESSGDDAGWGFDSGAGLYTVMWEPRLGVLYNLAPEKRFSPYIGLSAGMLSWQVRDLRYEDSVGFFPGGSTMQGFDEAGEQQRLHIGDVTAIATLGADYFLSDSFSLGIGARYHYLLDNDVDNIGLSAFWGPDDVDANTGLVEGFIGVNWFFGNPDSDGDGIPNRDDVCPNEAEDFDSFEDLDGCPEPDNDKDGILDTVDLCPETPEDRDGFQDEDGCPEPDNDEDGIIDAQDQCPDQAEDMDGFQDDDGCPDPDNDGDGILDGDDQCAGTPSGVEVDETGCPVVEEIREDLVLEGVTFASGSDRLEPASTTALDRVVESLTAWPEVRIEVQGHTDSSGSAELNRTLSQKRADSVRSYLIEKGIAANRVTAVGYGEDRPTADNSTAGGRAINRRVELHRLAD